jgi:hypothetical protein
MGRDFSVSASPGAAEVAAGKSATFTLTLVPAGGFNQAVTLGCSGVPQAASCAISPSSVMLDGTSSAQATVTLETTARTSAMPERGSRPRSPLRLLPMLFLEALAVLRAGWSARRAQGRFRLARASLVALMFVVLLWSACGGGGSGGGAQPSPPPPAGTPAGTYTLTLTGTHASLARSVTVTVTVK